MPPEAQVLDPRILWQHHCADAPHLPPRELRDRGGRARSRARAQWAAELLGGAAAILACGYALTHAHGILTRASGAMVLGTLLALYVAYRGGAARPAAAGCDLRTGLAHYRDELLRRRRLLIGLSYFAPVVPAFAGFILAKTADASLQGGRSPARLVAFAATAVVLYVAIELIEHISVRRVRRELDGLDALGLESCSPRS